MPNDRFGFDSFFSFSHFAVYACSSYVFAGKFGIGYELLDGSVSGNRFLLHGI